MVSTYENMKQTNITEIGNIPSDWSLIKLKFFSNIYGRIGFRGYTASDLVDEGEGAITLGPPNIENQKLNLKEKKYLSWEKYDESPEIKIYDGDLLLVKTASVGKVALVENLNYPTTINPQLTVFKNIQINNKYFYYTMVSDVIQHQIASNTNGGVIFTLSQENIQNYNIPLPSDEEQKQIADYLDQKTAKIDATIAKNEELIQLLEEKRVALINQVVTKGLNPDVPMKDSGVGWIGEIPEHWNVINLKHIANLQTGTTPSKNIGITQDKGINWFTPGDFDNTFKLNYSNKYITDDAIKTNNIKIYPPFSILMVCIGATIGKLGATNDFSYSNQQITAILPKLRVNYKYLLYYLISKTDYIKETANFTTLPILNNQHLSSFTITQPPEEEQKQIGNHLDYENTKINSIITKIKENISLLEEYKTSLIHHVVTGKIDVRGEEI